MNIKGVFKAAFPFISAAASAGGPLGTMAANAVGKALGVASAKPEDIESHIAGATPEQLVTLRQAELDFKLQMEKLGFENVEKLEAIAAGDRASARAREIALRDSTPKIIAFVVISGFFGLLYTMIFKMVPPGSETLINIMLGALTTAFVGIVNYYFGSSAGSARKTDIMANGSGK